jgi:hypothetical protein
LASAKRLFNPLISLSFSDSSAPPSNNPFCQR